MKTTRATALACMTSLVILVGAGQAFGGFFYQNLRHHGEYQANSGSNFRGPDRTYDPESSTQTFEALETGRVTDYYLAVWVYRFSGDPDFSLTLTDSSNNVLDSLTGIAPFGHKLMVEDFTPIHVVHLRSARNPTLIEGETYSVTLTVGGTTLASWEMENYEAIIKQFEERGLDVVGVAAVPEPSSLVLLGLGAVSLLASSRTRRNVYSRPRTEAAR